MESCQWNMTQSCLLQYLSSLKWDNINIDKYFTFTAWRYYYCIIQSMMIIMVVNIIVHVDVTVFLDHIFVDLVADYSLCSCHNEIMLKIDSLLLFSFMHLFCTLRLTCSFRLRLKTVREDEAEEWGDDKGVVTLLTSLSVQTQSVHLLQDWLKPEQLLKEGSKGSLSNCQFYDEVLYWTRALCSLITGSTHFYWQGSICAMILWKLCGH